MNEFDVSHINRRKSGARVSVLALVLVLVVFTAFDAWAGLRYLWQPKSTTIENEDATRHALAKTALAEGKVQEAKTIWLELAESYLKRNRLQEAAWTFIQAGEAAKGNEIAARLESILANEKVVSHKPIGVGVTASIRVTFENGMTAIFKNVDFATEIGAYRVDRALGLNLVPATVPREFGGNHGSIQIWIEDSMQAVGAGRNAGGDGTGTNITSSDLFFLDRLIGNIDRHTANYLVRPGDYLVAIDHGRTFGWGGYDFAARILQAEPIPRREVYERLVLIDEGRIDLASHLRDVLNQTQIDFLLKKVKERRAYIEGLIQTHGEATVFDAPEPFLAARLKVDEVLSGASTRDWKKVASSIASEPWLASMITKHAESRMGREGDLAFAAIGLGLYQQRRVSGDQAVLLASGFLANPPAEPKKADALLKKMLSQGPPGVFAAVMGSEWGRAKVMTDAVFFAALIDGEVKRKTLSSNWKQIFDVDSKLWGDPMAVRLVAESLPRGPEIQAFLFHSLSRRPDILTTLAASTAPDVHDSIFQAAFNEALLEKLKDRFFPYVKSIAVHIRPESLEALLMSYKPRTMAYPLTLAKFIDCMPQRQFRGAFKTYLRQSMSGEAKARLLEVVEAPGAELMARAAFAALTGPELTQSELHGKIKLVDHDGEQVARRVANLGSYGVRLYLDGNSSAATDVHFLSTDEAGLFSRLIRRSDGVQVQLTSQAKSAADIWDVVSEDLVFKLPDGTSVGWPEILAQLHQKPTLMEKFKSEEAVREARLKKLELRFGVAPADKSRWWNGFRGKGGACPAALVGK